MRFLNKLFGKKKSDRCESCTCLMQKVDIGKGFVKLSLQDVISGFGVAEECWECGRLYCLACFSSRPPNTCVCGKGRDRVRKMEGVTYEGSLRLIKVLYLKSK